MKLTIIVALALLVTGQSASAATVKRYFTFINETAVCADVVLALDYKYDSSRAPIGIHRSVAPEASWSGSYTYETGDAPRGHVLVNVGRDANCVGESAEIRLTATLNDASKRSRIVLKRNRSGALTLLRETLP